MIDGASTCTQSFIRRAGVRSELSDFLQSVCFRRRLTSGTDSLSIETNLLSDCLWHYEKMNKNHLKFFGHWWLQCHLK